MRRLGSLPRSNQWANLTRVPTLCRSIKVVATFDSAARYDFLQTRLHVVSLHSADALCLLYSEFPSFSEHALATHWVTSITSQPSCELDILQCLALAHFLVLPFTVSNTPALSPFMLGPHHRSSMSFISQKFSDEDCSPSGTSRGSSEIGAPAWWLRASSVELSAARVLLSPLSEILMGQVKAHIMQHIETHLATVGALSQTVSHGPLPPSLSEEKYFELLCASSTLILCMRRLTWLSMKETASRCMQGCVRRAIEVILSFAQTSQGYLDVHVEGGYVSTHFLLDQYAFELLWWTVLHHSTELQLPCDIRCALQECYKGALSRYVCTVNREMQGEDALNQPSNGHNFTLFDKTTEEGSAMFFLCQQLQVLLCVLEMMPVVDGTQESSSSLASHVYDTRTICVTAECAAEMDIIDVAKCATIHFQTIQRIERELRHRVPLRTVPPNRVHTGSPMIATGQLPAIIRIAHRTALQWMVAPDTLSGRMVAYGESASVMQHIVDAVLAELLDLPDSNSSDFGHDIGAFGETGWVQLCDVVEVLQRLPRDLHGNGKSASTGEPQIFPVERMKTLLELGSHYLLQNCISGLAPPQVLPRKADIMQGDTSVDAPGRRYSLSLLFVLVRAWEAWYPFVGDIPLAHIAAHIIVSPQAFSHVLRDSFSSVLARSFCAARQLFCQALVAAFAECLPRNTENDLMTIVLAADGLCLLDRRASQCTTLRDNTSPVASSLLRLLAQQCFKELGVRVRKVEARKILQSQSSASHRQFRQYIPEVVALCAKYSGYVWPSPFPIGMRTSPPLSPTCALPVWTVLDASVCASAACIHQRRTNFAVREEWKTDEHYLLRRYNRMLFTPLAGDTMRMTGCPLKRKVVHTEVRPLALTCCGTPVTPCENLCVASAFLWQAARRLLPGFCADMEDTYPLLQNICPPEAEVQACVGNTLQHWRLERMIHLLILGLANCSSERWRPKDVASSRPLLPSVKSRSRSLRSLHAYHPYHPRHGCHSSQQTSVSVCQPTVGPDPCSGTCGASDSHPHMKYWQLDAFWACLCRLNRSHRRVVGDCLDENAPLYSRFGQYVSSHDVAGLHFFLQNSSLNRSEMEGECELWKSSCFLKEWCDALGLDGTQNSSGFSRCLLDTSPVEVDVLPCTTDEFPRWTWYQSRLVLYTLLQSPAATFTSVSLNTLISLWKCVYDHYCGGAPDCMPSAALTADIVEELWVWLRALQLAHHVAGLEWDVCTHLVLQHRRWQKLFREASSLQEMHPVSMLVSPYDRLASMLLDDTELGCEGNMNYSALTAACEGMSSDTLRIFSFIQEEAVAGAVLDGYRVLRHHTRKPLRHPQKEMFAQWEDRLLFCTRHVARRCSL